MAAAANGMPTPEGQAWGRRGEARASIVREEKDARIYERLDLGYPQRLRQEKPKLATGLWLLFPEFVMVESDPS
jgi:hypothetical protein